MEMSIRFPGPGLVFDYVPRSFQIFGMEFTIYGVLIAVGALLGMGLTVLEAKRNGEDQNKYLDMMILSLLAAVIGSRLFYVIFSWDLYNGDIRAIMDLRNGGYAFYGGLLAGVLAAAVFCRITKMPFWRMADTASLGILLGQVIGRWGNFFNRESFGEYTDQIWAMQLPLSAVRSGEVSGTMRDNLLTIDGIAYIQVQPVFLYESLWCLILLLMLLALRRKKRYEGELFLRYLAGYGLGRFFFEWIRTDTLCIPGTKIGVSLIISAALFIICGPIVIVRRIMTKKREAIRRRRRKLQADAESSTEPDVETKNQNVSSDDDRDDKNNVQSEKEENAEGRNSGENENRNSAETETDSETSSEVHENQEESDENVNWENSEYAHIPEQWRQHVGKSPTNPEEDQ